MESTVTEYQKHAKTVKHRKNCETALWAKKAFIERKDLLKDRLY